MLAFAILYMVLPQFVSPNYDLAPRTLIWILLIAPVCLNRPRSLLVRSGFTTVLVLLCLYSLRGSWRDYSEINFDLDDCYAVLKQIPPSEPVSFRTYRNSMYIGRITPFAFSAPIITRSPAIPERSTWVERCQPRYGQLITAEARNLGPVWTCFCPVESTRADS